jgi:hypothetical protein
MSHSPRVCRVGSMALAPMLVALVMGAAVGIIWGLVLLAEKYLPEPSQTPVHESPVPGIIASCIMGAAVVAFIACAVYPWLYRHCRGAKYLAAYEALEQERSALEKTYLASRADVTRRMGELLKNGNSAEFNA